MVTGSDSARIYGVTNLQSYQVMKEFISRPSHAKVCKIDYASVINRNITIFSDTVPMKIKCLDAKQKRVNTFKGRTLAQQGRMWVTIQHMYITKGGLVAPSGH
ncbi:uncharacterized protein LOC141893262 [Acropora palmata]|uniref:uncharacterized protein LOC141893262 n=1 Tax=Acropora palmata TaxID=6131 RepID=UPI003DA0EEB3